MRNKSVWFYDRYYLGGPVCLRHFFKKEGHVKPIKKVKEIFSPAQNKFFTTIEAEIETPQLVTESNRSTKYSVVTSAVNWGNFSKY